MNKIFNFLKKYDFLKLIFWRVRSFFLKLIMKGRCPSLYKGKNVQIIGVNKVCFSQGISLGDGLWLNIKNAGLRDKIKTVHIGKHSNIGRYNFITVADKLNIGDYFFSSCYCMIINASHEANPFNPYIISPVVPLGNEINIGHNVFMGAHAKIIGGVNIGFGSIIGAGAVVTKNIPPLSQVVGMPSRVIARFSVDKGEWVKDLTEYKCTLSEQEYIQLIREKSPIVPIPHHAASVRNGWI